MSELSSNIFDKSQRQLAITEAETSKRNIKEAMDEKLKLLDQAEAKKDEQAGKVKEVLTTLGAIPLMESVKDTLAKTVKKGVKKVADTVADTVVDKVKSVTGDALDKTKSILSHRQLPENYQGLPKANLMNDNQIAENLGKRQKLARLKAKSIRENKPFNLQDNINSANNLDDELGKKSLLDSRNSMKNIGHAPSTLSDDTSSESALNPTDFFKTTTGNPTGELTKASYQNPSSIYNNEEALQGARDFKEFSSISARKEALQNSIMDKGLGTINRAPKSVNTIRPQLGDQLQPLRDANLAKAREVEPSTPKLKDIVSEHKNDELLDQDRQERQVGNIVSEPQEIPNPVFDPNQKIKPQAKVDDLGEVTTPASEDVAKTASESVSKDAGESVSKDIGEDVGKSAIKAGVEEGGEIAVGGGLDPFLDVAGAIVGLGTILGGIFGHHHHNPKPPPAPKALNPSVALGI